MSRPQAPRGYCCPKCGAKLISGRPRCWLCHAELTERTIVLAESVDERAAALPVPTGHLQYGISTLLLFMTFAAILCSIFTMSPGLGIVAAILSVPALLRTMVVASQRGKTGEPMSAGKKAGTFLTTMLLAIAALGAGGVAAFATFFLTCLVAASEKAGNLDAALSFAFVFSGIVGILVAAGFAWLIWKVVARNRGR